TFGSGLTSASRQAVAPRASPTRTSAVTRRATARLSRGCPQPPAAVPLTHDRRAPRPGRVLRRRRGARGPVAPHRAARRRRRPARARRRGDGELRRTQLRHPLGDVMCRGAPPLPTRDVRAPPPHALPRLLARGVV